MGGTRTEKDSFGPIEVPADRLWGAQTERSRRFFRISSERMPLPVVHALARVKKAAAFVNAHLGLLDARKLRKRSSTASTRPNSRFRSGKRARARRAT
jgi:fumarate hydratase class II